MKALTSMLFIGAFFITATLPVSLFSQQNTNEVDTLNKLVINLGHAIRVFPAEYDNCNRIIGEVREIRESATNAGQQMPKEYLLPFDDYNSLLQTAIVRKNEPLVATTLTNITIELDPRIKQLHAQLAFGKIGVPYECKVEVHVFRGNDEIFGVEVKANPLVYGTGSNAKYLFGRTDKQHPVLLDVIYGQKLFWAQSDTGQILGQTTQYVGTSDPENVRIQIN